MARYPNILCRVNAIKPEFIVRYVENFPKEPLPSTEFYTYVEQRMEGFHSRNYKQAPLQWGLYYEDNGYCYPRFNKNITNDEAKKYIEVWLHNLVVPNPYCSLSQIKDPVNLIVLLCEYMRSNPNVRNLHDIAYGACKERVKAIDILKNTIEQSNLFKIERGNIRYYKVKVKKEYENHLTSCDNQEILLKLANYFKEVYDPEEELTLLPDNIIGHSISFDELKKLPNIDKVLEFKPEYNIIVDYAPDFDKKYKSYSNMNSKEYFHLFDGVKTNFDKDAPLQQIFYGAPGTGKSHKIKEKTKGEAVIRTTFHPDSDYSTFVGAYKPTMDDVDVKVVPVALGESRTVFNKNEGTYKEKRIVYQFVMQAFLKAYLGAWKKYAEADDDEVKPEFLVIEEINRGNCAQIFGDLFQLLDRGDNGFSEYPIETDTDLQKKIERAFKEHKDYMLKEGVKINVEGVVENYTSNYGATLSEDIQSGRVLLLPSNFYIWATMNTSDQSLFPIDSAFKRRWDWEYMPIGYKNTNWTIEIGDKKYKWVDFQQKINDKIYNVDNSEDKQLGDYFVNADRTENKITAKTLLNKVLFYLWNDVCKDDPDQIFQWKDDKDNNQGKSIKFSEFFCDEDERDRKLQGFMAFNKVPEIGSQNANSPEMSQDADKLETSDSHAVDDNEVNS